MKEPEDLRSQVIDLQIKIDKLTALIFTIQESTKAEIETRGCDPIDIPIGFFYGQLFLVDLSPAKRIDFASAQAHQAFGHAVRIASFAKQTKGLLGQILGFLWIEFKAPRVLAKTCQRQRPPLTKFRSVFLIELERFIQHSFFFERDRVIPDHIMVSKDCQSLGAYQRSRSCQNRIAPGRSFGF